MSGLVVLVVEDDDALRAAVCDVLRDEGHDPIGMCNGRVALDFLHAANELPGVILLDLMMPVLDGNGFFAELRGDPRLAELPVLVMTAGRDIDRCPVPPEAVLLKPVVLDTLLDAVAKVQARGRD